MTCALTDAAAGRDRGERDPGERDLADCNMAVGIGLRTAHFGEFLSTRPKLDFVEVHSENFFARGGGICGGQPMQVLDRVRRDYALSLHGVGLSLGSAQAVDTRHLQQLQQLVRRCEPRWVSEHMSWTGIGGNYANDLLPLPYTEEALDAVAANILQVQDVLQRPLSIENPSRYLAFRHATMDEPEFLSALTTLTGCTLLLDINNVHVSAANLGFDAETYLGRIDPAAVAEIHLAGFTVEQGLLLDTHSSPVAEPVWQLYRQFISRCGHRPTLIEWDAGLPALPVLLGEAQKAADVQRASETDHAHAG